MSKKSIQRAFKKYRQTGWASPLRKVYFSNFLETMLYRTTKTENPETTKKMVARILHK